LSPSSRVSPEEMIDLRHRGSSKRAGCRIRGSLRVPIVPGVLTFSSRAPVDLMIGTRLDMTHRVRQFYFDSADADTLVADGPLDETYFSASSMASATGERSHVVHQHFLRVVETHEWLDDPMFLNKSSYTSKFVSTATSDAYPLSRAPEGGSAEGCEWSTSMPRVQFAYDIDALAIETWPVRARISSFVVSLCAILGGVMTGMRFLDSWAHDCCGTSRVTKRSDPIRPTELTVVTGFREASGARGSRGVSYI